MDAIKAKDIDGYQESMEAEQENLHQVEEEEPEMTVAQYLRYILRQGRNWRRSTGRTLRHALAYEHIVCFTCKEHIGMVSEGQTKKYCSKECRKKRHNKG